MSSTLIIPTIFLYLSHHSPLDDAFFVFRYIPFNPRVVQRIFWSKILRREPFSAPFGRRRTLSPPEILRLRKGGACSGLPQGSGILEAQVADTLSMPDELSPGLYGADGAGMGAFYDASSEPAFEESGKGLLASV